MPVKVEHGRFARVDTDVVSRSGCFTLTTVDGQALRDAVLMLYLGAMAVPQVLG